MGIITESEYQIRFFDIDEKKRVKTERLMCLLDDVAVYQSDLLGITIDYLQEKKCIWLLLQWDVEIIKCPSYREKIKVLTEPCGFKKFYGYRKYWIKNEKEELLLSAGTVWMLFDVESRKPLKVPDEMVKIYGVTENITFELEKIKKIGTSINKMEFIVSFSDIDTNGHVNNVKYIEWAMDTIPYEVFYNNRLCAIKNNYRKEGKYLDRIICSTEINCLDQELIILNEITNVNNEILCIIESHWSREK